MNKIFTPKAMIGALALTAATVAGTCAYNNHKAAQQQQEQEQTTHMVDSIAKAKGIAPNDVYGRAMVRMFDVPAEQMYKMDCEKYLLNPNLPESRQQLEEIKTLEHKKDSIQMNNIMHSIIKDAQP